MRALERSVAKLENDLQHVDTWIENLKIPSVSLLKRSWRDMVVHPITLQFVPLIIRRQVPWDLLFLMRLSLAQRPKVGRGYDLTRQGFLRTFRESGEKCSAEYDTASPRLKSEASLRLYPSAMILVHLPLRPGAT